MEFLHHFEQKQETNHKVSWAHCQETFDEFGRFRRQSQREKQDMRSLNSYFKRFPSDLKLYIIWGHRSFGQSYSADLMIFKDLNGSILTFLGERPGEVKHNVHPRRLFGQSTWADFQALWRYGPFEDIKSFEQSESSRFERLHIVVKSIFWSPGISGQRQGRGHCVPVFNFEPQSNPMREASQILDPWR